MARSEASGLLMSVIRTLHETDTGQEREEEKRKLEAEFKIAKGEAELANLKVASLEERLAVLEGQVKSMKSSSE